MVLVSRDRLTRLLSVYPEETQISSVRSVGGYIQSEVQSDSSPGSSRSVLCMRSVAVRIVPKGPRQKRQYLRDLYTARRSFGDSGERLFVAK
jgi:hypothetical protein